MSLNKYRKLNLSEKKELIKLCEQDSLSLRKAAIKFGIGKTYVDKILKNKNVILEERGQNDVSMRRQKEQNYPPNNKLSLEDPRITFYKNLPESMSTIRENEMNDAITTQNDESFCSSSISEKTENSKDGDRFIKFEKELEQSNKKNILHDYINEIVQEILRNKRKLNIHHEVTSNKENENLKYTPFYFVSPYENLKNVNPIQSKDVVAAQKCIRQKCNLLKKIKDESNNNQPNHIKMDAFKNIPTDETILENLNESYKKPEQYAKNNLIDMYTSTEKLNKLVNNENGKKHRKKIDKRQENSKLYNEKTTLTNVDESVKSTSKSNSKFEDSQLASMVYGNISPINYDNWEDPNDLIDRLRELHESGSTDHKEEISRILYELRKAKIIY